jgi:hypothetical protein
MTEKEKKERKEKKEDYQKPELKKEGDLRDITAGDSAPS